MLDGLCDLIAPDGADRHKGGDPSGVVEKPEQLAHAQTWYGVRQESIARQRGAAAPCVMREQVRPAVLTGKPRMPSTFDPPSDLRQLRVPA